MAKKRISDEDDTEKTAILKEFEEAVDAAYVEKEPSILHLRPNGQPIGKERVQERFKLGGVVFLHCANRKIIRARSRDLSATGVGISVRQKVKSYRVGERFILEFSPPHKLQNLLLPVELTRFTYHNGHNQFGFRIVAEGRALKKLNDFISFLRGLDPWF